MKKSTIILCVLVFSAVGQLFGTTDFDPIEVVNREKRLSNGSQMAIGAGFIAASRLRSHVGNNNLLKMHSLKQTSLDTLSQINAGKPLNAADVYHTLWTNYRSILIQANIRNLKRDPFLIMGVGGLYLFGQGVLSTYQEFKTVKKVDSNPSVSANNA